MRVLPANRANGRESESQSGSLRNFSFRAPSLHSRAPLSSRANSLAMYLSGLGLCKQSASERSASTGKICIRKALVSRVLRSGSNICYYLQNAAPVSVQCSLIRKRRSRNFIRKDAISAASSHIQSRPRGPDASGLFQLHPASAIFRCSGVPQCRCGGRIRICLPLPAA